MKIEIELIELENIRKEADVLREENIKLQKENKELGKEEMEKKAIRLSEKLFNEYMKATFNGLGFCEPYSSRDVVAFENLGHWIGKEWYKRPDAVSFSLSVNITKQFRSAFLSMGVLMGKGDSPKEANLLDTITD